jgi:hypothetical protein
LTLISGGLIIMAEDTIPSGNPTESGGPKGEVAYESFKKVLDEKKRLAQKLAEFEAREQDLERAKLEEQGKYKEALEKMQKDLLTERDARKQERSKFGNSILSAELKSLAKGLGAKDDALDALVTLAYNQGLGEIPAIGEDFSVNKDALKTYLGEFQQKNQFLFSKEVTPPKQVVPGSSIDTSTAGLKDKSVAELSKMLAELNNKK